MADAGRWLIALGVLMVLIGGALMIFGRFHLPGDLTIKSGGVTIWLPIASSVIASIVLTLVLNFLIRNR